MLALALTMLAPAAGGALMLHLWQTRKPRPKAKPPMAVYTRRTAKVRA